MIAMVIDEDRGSIEAAASMLNHQGIRVISAGGVDEALSLLESKKVDLILSEAFFAEKNGIDLIGALKGNPAWSKLPVVFLSNTDDARVREVLSGLSSYVFIKKPLSYELFMPLIQQLFPGRKLFIKDYKLLFTITEMDEVGLVQMLDDFQNSLDGLYRLVESRVAKATLRASFMDALSYAQMIGTAELSALFQQYMDAQGVDLVQLKQNFSEIQRQLLQAKEMILGIGVAAEVKEGKKAEDSDAVVKEDTFVLRVAKMLDEAQNGLVDSQYELSMLYLVGSPENRNIPEGERWLKEAARNRQPQAMFRLALQSLLKEDLSVASMRASVSQMNRIVNSAQSGECEFWKEQISKAIASVEEMMQTGQTEAFCMTSHLQHAMHAPDIKYAVFCLYHATYGNTECQYWVGEIYENGKYMSPILSLAAYWLELASSSGHVEASYRLGILYQQHLTGHSDEDGRAFKCFEVSAGKGHLYSQFYLAKLYYNGVGTEANMGQARHWYETAAQQGHAQAQFWLGMIFEETNSTQTDLRDALKWYIISLANGSALASKQIPIVEKKMVPHEIEMARSAADRYIKIQESRKNTEKEAVEGAPEKAPAHG